MNVTLAQHRRIVQRISPFHRRRGLASAHRLFLIGSWVDETGRFEWIRTTDLTVIGRLLYRAELRSEMEHGTARRDRTADLTLGVPYRLSYPSECLLWSGQ